MSLNHTTQRIYGLIAVIGFYLAAATTTANTYHIDDFYEALAPYGSWVEHPQYQRVWYPHNVPNDWRPYTYGHWSYTHEHGWLWVSDWEWGWAPFHYGRWDHDHRYGWVWVPGSVWGPGWVAWRRGDSYIGWAPLPPHVAWHETHGLSSELYHEDYGIAPTHWSFIEDRYFTRPHIHHHVYLSTHNASYLRLTHHVTQFTIVDHHIVNRCIPVRHIEYVTRRPLRIVHVRDVHRHHDHHHRYPAHADYINIYRPRIRHVHPAHQPGKRYTDDYRPGNPPTPRWSGHQQLHRDTQSNQREETPQHQHRHYDTRRGQSHGHGPSRWQQREQPIKHHDQSSHHGSENRPRYQVLPAQEPSASSPSAQPAFQGRQNLFRNEQQQGRQRGGKRGDEKH